MLEELIGCWLNCNSSNLVTFISEEISVAFLVEVLYFFSLFIPWDSSEDARPTTSGRASSSRSDGPRPLHSPMKVLLFEVKEQCHGHLSARASLRLFISSGPSATGERLIFLHRWESLNVWLLLYARERVTINKGSVSYTHLTLPTIYSV